MRLHDACFAGDVKAVKRLLAAGADPNALAPTRWKQRPLHRTLEFRLGKPRDERHAAIVRLLLDAGADATLRATSRALTPWELGCIVGAADSVKLLRPFQKEAEPNPEAPDALWIACASRLAEAPLVREVRRQLRSQPIRRWRSISPLMIATGHAAHFAVAEMLLAGGADPNDGVSLLHASCDWHFEHLLPALDWFAAHGWDVDARDEQGQTALHKAAFLGYATAAKKLLALGADANARDRNGKTPRDVARAARKPAVERLL